MIREPEWDELSAAVASLPAGTAKIRIGCALAALTERCAVPTDDMPSPAIVTGRYAEVLPHLLRERGIMPDDYRVLPMARPEEVEGRWVIGGLPLHMAARALLVTEIPVRVPQRLRGHRDNLDVDDVRQFAGRTEHYSTRRIESADGD